jgi:hypothetical protein
LPLARMTYSFVWRVSVSVVPSGVTVSPNASQGLTGESPTTSTSGGDDRQLPLPRGDRLDTPQAPDPLRHDRVVIDRGLCLLPIGTALTSVGVMSPCTGRGCALAICVDSEFIATYAPQKRHSAFPGERLTTRCMVISPPLGQIRHRAWTNEAPRVHGATTARAAYLWRRSLARRGHAPLGEEQRTLTARR